MARDDRRARARRVGGDLSKTAKAQAPTRSAQQETPLFCFRHADRTAKNEEWRFSPSAEDAPELFDFMCEMCRLTWAEIQSHTAGGHKKHHSQPVTSIDAKAQKDLQTAHLDETFGDDDIFRFRLSGEKRFWGFRRDRTFHVVWWDPNHKVYEQDK